MLSKRPRFSPGERRRCKFRITFVKFGSSDQSFKQCDSSRQVAELLMGVPAPVIYWEQGHEWVFGDPIRFQVWAPPFLWRLQFCAFMSVAHGSRPSRLSLASTVARSRMLASETSGP